MSGQAGDLDELPAQLAELRELIREAHGATKDLRTAIREARDYAGSLTRIVDSVGRRRAQGRARGRMRAARHL